eukprot:TRINITY_DN21167_c0_g1_i3.p2 TRINITY_DN21167_c0_g1~~TRINITY_DN21167_c0_g1_i3.p2  ORF type:complete len:142 (-),score=32.51 TRINITY_DN21167_c0_g1_i3:338-763(-)
MYLDKQQAVQVWRGAAESQLHSLQSQLERQGETCDSLRDCLAREREVAEALRGELEEFRGKGRVWRMREAEMEQRMRGMCAELELLRIKARERETLEDGVRLYEGELGAARSGMTTGGQGGQLVEPARMVERRRHELINLI